MNPIEALQWRYAVRKFSKRKLAAEVLRQLAEATRLSPSSYGLQPYKVLLVESKSIRRRLLAVSYGQEKVLQSSHLLVVAAETQIGDATVDRYIHKYAQLTGRPLNELADYAAHIKAALAGMTAEEKQAWAQQQAYLALGNLLTSAAVMKVDTCPMAGFDREGYDEVLGLEAQGLTATVICALGYRHPEDEHANTPKVRFDFGDMVLEY